jgi:ankyrin repeat protein
MKKTLIILAFLIAGTASAQELTREITIALKDNNLTALKPLVNKTNKSACLTYGKRTSTLLQLAVQMNSNEIVSYLATEAKSNLNETCDDMTPLMWAAKFGRTEIAKTLIKAGADTSVTVDGKTAKNIALENKHNEIAALLK